MKRTAKNYYVMDTCLENQDMDKFRHKEISNSIFNLITNDKYPTPYNIALIGKWGLGKSSILKILENSLKKENKKYKVISINAWKYESETLKKVFLKEIYEKVSNSKINYIKQLEEQLKSIFSQNDSKAKREKKNIFSIILPLIISLILSFIWQLVHYISNGGSFLELFSNNFWYLICRYFSFYFEKILFTFGVPVLLTFLPDLLNKKSNIFPIQIDYQNDYETLLKNLMKKETKIDKFIVIIDDLDRLSTKKMVEALDTLKTLMEIDKCIFIVPFDDSILKDALNKQIISKFDNEQQVIESEFILDKLFQFRFYIPPLINSDMKDYTLNIIKNESKDLYKMFNDDEIDEIVKKVFMYDGLKTPRQIKKIINTFSNNMLLFTARVRGGKIDSDLLNKSGKLMIAKISVLQSDFNDFYDDLFIDSDICEKMLKANKNEYDNYKNIPKIIQKYFIFKDNNVIIKEQHDKLINFLSRTSYIKSPDISIYLRCNQDKMSLLYGSDFNRKLSNSMQSMNFTLMNAIIQENKPNNIKNLFIDYLERDASYNLPMLIISIMNVKDFEFDDDAFNEKYINSISNVYNSGEKFDLQYVNLEQLLKLSRRSSDETVGRILNDYFNLLNDNVDSTEFKHNDIFKVTIMYLNDLKSVEKNTIKSYLYSLCRKNFSYIKMLNDISVSENLMKIYFGVDLYKLIINELNTDDNSKYSVYSELLIKIYNSLKNDSNITSINEDIINLLDNENNISLCKSIITSNIHLFNLNEKNKILNKIINMDNNELELQYYIINSLLIDVTSENEKFQNKIISFIDNDYDVENILNNISDYSLIDNVVKKMNNKIYSNSKFDSVYKKNVEKFSDEQLDGLVDTLSSTININTYKEGRLTSIVTIMHDYMHINELVKCFTDDELIKNDISFNEMIGVIKHNDDIEESVIDNYVKRIIELLPTSSKNLILLEKLTKYISYDNLRLLIATINEEIIGDLEEDELKSLFNIYKGIKINENNIKELTMALNSLIYTDVYNQTINYMISNSIIINDSIDFVFENIGNLNKLKKYNNLNSILKIDDNFINSLIESLKTSEYSMEQLKYLISLNEKISNTIKNYSFTFDSNNKYLILNIQKMIYDSGDENDLTCLQIKILKSNDNELIEYMLVNLLPIEKSVNRKQIKNALEDLINNDNTTELLVEKAKKFAKENSYKGLKIKREEKTLV